MKLFKNDATILLAVAFASCLSWGLAEGAENPANNMERTDSAPTKPRVGREHDKSRFQRALQLIDPRTYARRETPRVTVGEPDYLKARELLELNIRENPSATNIDYDLGWAMLCCAKLKDYDAALSYYTILRKEHYGWLTDGASGAQRNWEKFHTQVREEIRLAGTTEAAEIVSAMETLDREAYEKFRQQTIRLVTAVNSGDRHAVEDLKHMRYHHILVDLMAEGAIVVSADAKKTSDQEMGPF